MPAPGSGQARQDAPNCFQSSKALETTTMIKPKDIIMIHDLKRQGLSIAAIARETGFDRKNVRLYLARDLEAPPYKLRHDRPLRRKRVRGTWLYVSTIR